MSKRWTFEEELIIKNNFETMGSDIILLLPDRSLNDIKERIKVIKRKEETKKIWKTKWENILCASVFGREAKLPENFAENFEKACNVLEDLGGGIGCAVLRMFYKEGMGFDEIAYNLVLDVDEVKMIHHYFIMKMKSSDIKYILAHGETIVSKKYKKYPIGVYYIEGTDLSNRAFNILRRGGIYSIEQLVTLSESDLRKLMYMDDIILDEIKNNLKKMKFKLAD